MSIPQSWLEGGGAGRWGHVTLRDPPTEAWFAPWLGSLGTSISTANYLYIYPKLVFVSRLSLRPSLQV